MNESSSSDRPPPSVRDKRESDVDEQLQRCKLCCQHFRVGNQIAEVSAQTNIFDGGAVLSPLLLLRRWWWRRLFVEKLP